MSAESQMVVLSGKLALEFLPKALAGSGIPEPITRIVLGTMIGALQEQQNAFDEKLRRLVGRFYQSGVDYLADARSLQGERREQWIKSALDQFVTASHVEDTLLAAKSQFFVGVCYDLLNESLLAREWYERAYRSAAQLAAQKQGSLRMLVLNNTVQELVPLQQLMNALSPVLFAHGSTLLSQTPTLHLIRLAAPSGGLRAFQIILDDKKIGVIRQAESSTFEVQAGHHILYLQLGLAVRSTAAKYITGSFSSPSLSFDIAPGEKVLFLCKSSVSLLRPYIELWKQ